MNITDYVVAFHIGIRSNTMRFGWKRSDGMTVEFSHYEPEIKAGIIMHFCLDNVVCKVKLVDVGTAEFTAIGDKTELIQHRQLPILTKEEFDTFISTSYKIK